MDPHAPIPRCSMNMLWNTQIVDTCIVFRLWHVGSRTTFILSCAIIMALGIFYEALRVFQKNVDARLALELINALGGIGLPLGDDTIPDFEHTQEAPKEMIIPLPFRVLRATLYGASVFLSFFLMLIFMTYNISPKCRKIITYLILATVLGAAVGHFLFAGTMNVDGLHEENRGIPCH
ncbi:Ctr copper transporter [Mycena latifolia]|nr:Ctr copper transporter [Mycena latifolia]